MRLFLGYLQIAHLKNYPPKECYLRLFRMGPLILSPSLLKKWQPMIEKVLYEPNSLWIQTPQGLFYFILDKRMSRP